MGPELMSGHFLGCDVVSGQRRRVQGSPRNPSMEWSEYEARRLRMHRRLGDHLELDTRKLTPYPGHSAYAV